MKKRSIHCHPLCARVGFTGSLWCLWLLTVIDSCAGTIRFTDVTSASGVNFVHSDGSSGRRFIVETVASGLATFDFDRDGWIDILFLNGAPLPGADPRASGRALTLYRNRGDGTFEEVTEKAGLFDEGYHLGVCVGDYDNDGHRDIFLNNFGPNVLYRNQGNGTFIEVTSQAGLDPGNSVGAGACFLDADGDGDLDLFIAQYVGFTLESHHTTFMNGLPAYVGPLNYPPSHNLYYQNQGNGTFVDATQSAGLDRLQGSGMGVIACDLDNDRDTDLVVGNDLRPDFLLRNDGTGHFTEEGTLGGIAYDAFGQVQGSMGVECADWNHDGWFDLLITPYQRQLPTLFESRKGLFYEDVARQVGLGNGSYVDVKWGVGWVDFNQDGYHDVFIACGHLLDNAEQIDASSRYAAPNLLYEHSGKSAYEHVTHSSGDGMKGVFSSRGAVFDDLDNDGDVDAVVLNARGSASVLRNDTRTGAHWLQVELEGAKSNRDGIGARVYVQTANMKQMDEVHSGRSYQSDFGWRLQFGLGDVTSVSELRVDWIGGGTDTFRDVRADQRYRIVEGQGIQSLSMRP